MDTEGLREYMIKYGDLEDCIVMKVGLNSYFDFYDMYLFQIYSSSKNSNGLTGCTLVFSVENAFFFG